MTDQAAAKEIPSAPTLRVEAPVVKMTAPHEEHPRRRPIVIGALAVVVAAVGLYFYLPSLWQVSTDDAFVNAHVVLMVPKVPAYVSKLHVDDNSKVARGDLVVELDPRDFEVAVDIANADLKSAQANAENIKAQLLEQQALVGRASLPSMAIRPRLISLNSNSSVSNPLRPMGPEPSSDFSRRNPRCAAARRASA